MKKLLLYFVLLIIPLVSFAGKGKYVVTGGDKTILQEHTSAQLIIDYSNAMWEDRHYESFCGNDYQERIDKSYKTFFSEFNNKSKGLLLTQSNDAKYKMTIKVQKFLRKVRSFYRGEVMVWCTIQITDTTTGKELLKIDVSKSGGESDYSYSDGIYKCFAALAERINK